jgi:hypothetical protein
MDYVEFKHCNILTCEKTIERKIVKTTGADWSFGWFFKALPLVIFVLE